MTKLSLTLPIVGEKNTVADPKITTALKSVETVVNGELETTNNLKAEGIEDAAIKKGNINFERLLTKKSIIATSEERENVAYGTMPTPDEVEVVMPANGLIAVAYQATWKASVEATLGAALFVGALHVKVPTIGGGVGVGGEITQLVKTAQLANWGAVNSSASPTNNGLNSTNFTESYTAEATTGQIVGIETLGAGHMEIFAAAGTYKISIQFRASAGKVTVKNRKLWAWCVA